MSLAIALLLTQSLDIFNFKSSRNDNKQIELKINSLKDKIDLLETKKDTINIADGEVQSLRNRIQILEDLISKNPENLLEIQKTENQFERIDLIMEKEKEINDQKIENIEDKLNTYSNIIFSLLVTIIGTILAFLLSNLRNNKSSTNN